MSDRSKWFAPPSGGYFACDREGIIASRGPGLPPKVPATPEGIRARDTVQVKAEALREAAEALAIKDFLLPQGHAPMSVAIDWLRVRADRIEQGD